MNVNVEHKKRAKSQSVNTFLATVLFYYNCILYYSIYYSIQVEQH